MATTYDPTTSDPGQIEKVAAGSVVIDPNVRKTVRLDKSFVSSIRVYGFQQHPVGYRDGDQVHITVGQRRTSAALEIGWPVIPIVVKPKPDAEHDRAEELRILSQLAENEQRESLTDSERVAGYKQLALLGVTEDQIARKTNAPKQHIQTALAVASSDVAVDALQSRPITLEQAAYVVEFQDDAAAVEEITTTLTERPEQIDHTVARIRRDRADEAAVEARATELEAEGWTVHREKNHYGFAAPKGTHPLRELCRNGDDNQGIDPADAGDLTDRHAVVYPYAGEARASFYVGSLTENGISRRSYYSSGKRELTDAEKAARRQKRADKADMILATDVRREWIKTFLGQKKLPDITQWIAHVAFQTSHALGASQREGNARDLAYELLGLEQPSTKYGYMSREASADFITKNPALAAPLTAAYAIAICEDVIGDPKHAWAGLQMAELSPYLEQLRDWGYTLSDVEHRLVNAASENRRKADK